MKKFVSYKDGALTYLGMWQENGKEIKLVSSLSGIWKYNGSEWTEISPVPGLKYCGVDAHPDDNNRLPAQIVFRQLRGTYTR